MMSDEEELKILFGDPEAKNAPLGILRQRNASQDASGAILGDWLDRLDLPICYIPGVCIKGATCEVCHRSFTSRVLTGTCLPEPTCSRSRCMERFAARPDKTRRCLGHS
jgi:hypothetical protein